MSFFKKDFIAVNGFNEDFDPTFANSADIML